MAVVGIIGILSMLAIPSYQHFKAKARQKEGFQLLTTYYQAAIATRTEFKVFPGDFVQTGFQPTGQLGYRLRVADGAELRKATMPANQYFIGTNINDDNCIITSDACDCDAMACPNYKTWDELPQGMVGTIGVALNPNAACGGATIAGAPAVTNTTFTAIAAGWVSVYAALADRYAINQNKVIDMCSDGLK